MMGFCDILIKLHSACFYQVSMYCSNTKKVVEVVDCRAVPQKRKKPVIYDSIKPKISKRRARQVPAGAECQSCKAALDEYENTESPASHTPQETHFVRLGVFPL